MAVVCRLLTLIVALSLYAQTPVRPSGILPLNQIKAGMKGTGRTVFSGTTVSSFDAEILGVLENVGPKQSIILARLSGGPLDRTGVLQGMSGSPVYIGGKLIGAVALAFPYSKEPIAGIRPIEEMLATAPVARTPTARAQITDTSLVARIPEPVRPADRPAEMMTPLSLTGFTQATVDHFAPQLRRLGLEPAQGLSAGRAPRPAPPAPPEPGSMISVQLVNGDMAVGADGTVTHVDGNRVYAFGHRFLAVGATEVPFTSASVITLLPNVNVSYKISASGKVLGAITTDYNAAVSGEFGKKARMANVNVTVQGDRQSKYHVEMAQDQLMTPLLLQMVVYSALDASERTVGSSSVRVRGDIRFDNVSEPVHLDTMYAGDYNVPLVASLGTTMPVAYVLQNSVDTLRVESVDLTIEAVPVRKQYSIENLWTSKRTVRPGESFDIFVLLAGDGNKEVTHKIAYEVPIGAPVGPLSVTVADGPSANAADGRVFSLAQPKPAAQVIPLLNSLRGTTKAYIRLWRQDPTYIMEGQDLPDPPPSVGMILARLPGALPAVPRTATVHEFRFDAGEDAVISGSKTIQVEVRE